MRNLKILLIVVVWLFASSVSEANTLYWTDFRSGQIEKSNMDGTGRSVVLSELNSPAAISVDSDNQKIYWSEVGDYTWKVRRSNLDGSNAEDLVSNIRGVTSIDIDPVDSKMYMVDTFSSSIYRTDLDGSNLETLVSAHQSNPLSPYGVVIDSVNRYMYYSDSTYGIFRMPIGPYPNPYEQVAYNFSGSNRPGAIDFDPTTGNVYWLDHLERTIKMIPPDPDMPIGQTVLTLGSLDDNLGLAVDSETSTLYFGQYSPNDTIFQASLDGSGLESLITTDLNTPYEMDILFESSAAVPLPTSIFLLGSGLAGLLAARKRRG